MIPVNTFYKAIDDAFEQMEKYSYPVHTERWQGVNVGHKPEMMTYEVLNHSLQVIMGQSDLLSYKRQIRPNLPWADDHFEERIGGEPLNPGIQWAKWPWGNSANAFRDDQGQFDHNYMERYWPKYAGFTPDGRVTDELKEQKVPHSGIRNAFGDLRDVINLLEEQPYTRQAYFPIFFPEDTGSIHGGRVPCSLGHHFILRGHYLHQVYYIRSCDLIRHFQDDIYLSLRLQLYILEELKLRNDFWANVIPGLFTMHITSLHLFMNDYIQRFGKRHPRDSQ